MKSDASLKRVAPPLPYAPRDPARSFRIGLIGCGDITKWHLKAYRKAGYSVVALCDIDPARAAARRRRFYPQAAVYSDYRDLLARADIDVLDVTPHPQERAPILEAAIDTGRHTLSQKPFTLDLDFGRRLVRRAARKGVKLAVNQNGRWAPHFAYIREAARAGLIGAVNSVHMSVHWSHNWVVDFPAFNRMRHLILYDFAIHWFDMLHSLMAPRRARRVYASFTRTPGQAARPALLGQAVVQYDDAQASLVFDGDQRIGGQDRVFVGGDQGSLTSLGFHRAPPKVTLTTAAGAVSPKLRGKWFPDGFHGAMGELLCAIEEDREPSHGAAENLHGLALCFAAVQSAETGKPVAPGSCKRLEKRWLRPVTS